MLKLNHLFGQFSKWAARYTGHPLAFALAAMLIVAWAITGPIFGFSDTWQIIINTATTIITFLMVFLIQSSQNRDTAAIQTKLDELIRALEGAHNALLDLEELDEADIERIRQDYRLLATEARKQMQRGASDTEVRELKSHGSK